MAGARSLATPGDRIALTLGVLATAGPAVGGLWLRARPSPVREAVLAWLERLLPEAARFGPETDATALTGGIDIGASLAAGRRVITNGLLERQGRLTLTGAERLSPALAALLGQELDRCRSALVALDEGAEPEEAPPAVLVARLGLYLDLNALRPADVPAMEALPARAQRARGILPSVAVSPELDTVLAEYAALFGITDLRLHLGARQAAAALAALEGREEATRSDIDLAAGLVLAPRGIPPEIQPVVDEPDADRNRDNADGEMGGDETGEGLEDRMTEAAALSLPSELLAGLHRAPACSAAGQGAGQVRRGTTRGRPLPSRPGRLSARTRIDPVATLRAALPWQKLRPPSPRGQPLALRLSDIRVRRFEERSDRVIIFAVDASGSLAMARMAEAKGAVECLLSESYRHRDQVALVAFRGDGADVLLPPTRALVRARASLAALPAGGGTPLAAGLNVAMETARRVRASGATPVVVLLSDGRGNIALDGTPDRVRAAADAEVMAAALRRQSMECLVLDTGRRPTAALEALSATLDARYIALPFAQAQDLSAAVSAALDS